MARVDRAAVDERERVAAFMRGFGGLMSLQTLVALHNRWVNGEDLSWLPPELRSEWSAFLDGLYPSRRSCQARASTAASSSIDPS